MTSGVFTVTELVQVSRSESVLPLALSFKTLSYRYSLQSPLFIYKFVLHSYYILCVLFCV